MSHSAAEPMATGFPFSRTIVQIRSTRTIKNTGRTSVEERYYLSSQEAKERTAEGWINLTRAHWAGVENRNHWRRDATQGEDATRTRNPRAVINLALIRSANLRLLAHGDTDEWLPVKKERLAAYPSCAFTLIHTKL